MNYFASSFWVFQEARFSGPDFILFAIIGAGGLGWTELIMWIGVDFYRTSVLAVKAIALALVLIWNFGMRKRFVFARPADASSA